MIFNSNIFRAVYGWVFLTEIKHGFIIILLQSTNNLKFFLEFFILLKYSFNVINFNSNYILQFLG